MKGFTITCNACGHSIVLQTGQDRLNDNLFLSIHSSTSCGILCLKCEEKVLLEDK